MNQTTEENKVETDQLIPGDKVTYRSMCDGEVVFDLGDDLYYISFGPLGNYMMHRTELKRKKTPEQV